MDDVRAKPEKPRRCSGCGEELGKGEHKCNADYLVTDSYDPRPDKPIPTFKRPGSSVKTKKELSIQPLNSLLGEVIGEKYLIERCLGSGAMGVVFKAKHLLIDRHVAIKVMSPERIMMAGAKDRFRREARFAGRVLHKNIVANTDFGVIRTGPSEAEESLFIVMELLEGESLRDRLKAIKQFHWETAMSIMLPIAEALAIAHNAGLCHRDIKPENIFLARRSNIDDTPMLLDFGIAKQLDRRHETSSAAPDTLQTSFDPYSSTLEFETSTLEMDTPLFLTPQELVSETLTRTGTIVGTPLYMSPEQLKGQRIDQRSDIYSFWAVVHEMISGDPPIAAVTLNSFIDELLHQPPRPFSLELKVPLVLENAVKRGLAKNRNDRQQNMKEVIWEIKINHPDHYPVNFLNAPDF